jgi:hypothetical protein
MHFCDPTWATNQLVVGLGEEGITFESWFKLWIHVNLFKTCYELYMYHSSFSILAIIKLLSLNALSFSKLVVHNSRSSRNNIVVYCT